MQTIFRLPWSTEPSGDKALVEKLHYQQQKSRPRLEISSLNTKRKRTGSVEASPNRAPFVKKIKLDDFGAVQPTPEPVRGVDARSTVPLTEAGAQTDRITKSARVSLSSLSRPAGGIVAPKAVRDDRIKLSSAPASLQSQPTVTEVTPSIAQPTSSLGTLKEVLPPSIATMSDSAVDSRVRVEKMRAVIENQFNLEILYKHNELRMIEQELAKCQVGLEQLRRCEIIPYPGSTRPSQTVSTGIGFALQSPQPYAQPEYAAPWGVTDGPYSRHYAKWLIQDPSFDPSLVQSAASTPLTARGVRATRGNGAESLLPTLPARHPRAAAGLRAAWAHDPSTPSAPRDPMIMKRQSDGEWVRLRCPHDGRSNFNNIQGFLNHCRISHQQQFESHESAAVVCGEIVHMDENNDGTEPAPAARDFLTRATGFVTPTDQLFANPFNFNSPVHQPQDRVLTRRYAPGATTQPTPSVAAHTLPSGQKSQTSYLKSLMARRGMSTTGLDLTVQENKMKVDLSVYDDSGSERDGPEKKRQKTRKPKGTVRHPSSGQFSLPSSSTLGTARPLSQKSSRAPQSNPVVQQSQESESPLQSQFDSFSSFGSRTASAMLGASMAQTSKDVDGDAEMGLSPGTVTDSNPGLVSDHEDDYDDADEDARSAHAAHVEMIDGIAVHIEDASDVEGDGRKQVRVGETPVCRSEPADVAEASGGIQ